MICFFASLLDHCWLNNRSSHLFPLGYAVLHHVTHLQTHRSKPPTKPSHPSGSPTKMISELKPEELSNAVFQLHQLVDNINFLFPSDCFPNIDLVPRGELSWGIFGAQPRRPNQFTRQLAGPVTSSWLYRVQFREISWPHSNRNSSLSFTAAWIYDSASTFEYG